MSRLSYANYGKLKLKYEITAHVPNLTLGEMDAIYLTLDESLAGK
jgi:hypothetical protein